MPQIIRPAGYTGSIQTLTVDATIAGTCTMSAWGGAGGGGGATGTSQGTSGNGSGGNYASVAIAVQAGDTIDVIVGGPGGVGAATNAAAGGTSGAALFTDLHWSMKYAGLNSTGPQGSLSAGYVNGAQCDFLNSHGVWDENANSVTLASRQWTVAFNTTGWYTFMVSANGTAVMTLDSTTTISSASSSQVTFQQIYVTAGTHTIAVSAQNFSGTGSVAVAVLQGQWFSHNTEFTFPGVSYAGGLGGRGGPDQNCGGGGGGGGATVIRHNGTVILTAGGGGGGGGAGQTNFISQCNAPGQLISLATTQGGSAPAALSSQGGGGGGGGGYSTVAGFSAGQYGQTRNNGETAFGGSYGRGLGDVVAFSATRAAAQPASAFYDSSRALGGSSNQDNRRPSPGSPGFAVLQFDQAGASVRYNNVWNEILDTWVRQDNVWKPVLNTFVKQNGVWQVIQGTNDSAPNFVNQFTQTGSVIGTNYFVDATV